ncbi:glycosyltransferase family 4 protein [Candidatus Uabimicrobium amorphum]|uniref:Glycosyl transferase n=1 Tax=Uabimicrobium amorphum TaxID=2596890 RepID=A0A5S9IRS9_UABAM|nr:glycosyltransferase family 4 protein [Candidatus Uabimicrobium amorphum]BBM86909.1 glycosyl transferase [Candidatus Uabimicrobium amorphum]
MKILQIPRRFVKEDWGGTETVILETSKSLKALGHQTEIICPNILTSRHEEYIEGIRVKRCPYFYPYYGLSKDARRLLDKRGGNIFSLALMRQLRRMPANIFHLHTGKRIGGIASYIAKKRNIPFVISLHGGVYDVPQQERESWTSPTKGTLEWGKVLGLWVGSRSVLQNAAAIICVGKKEHQEVQKRFPNKRALFLPNGVDVKHFSQQCNPKNFRNKYCIDRHKKIILQVGRITPQKNQQFSLELLNELRKKHQVHLVLIGPVNDHIYFAQLQKYIAQHNLQNCVTIIQGLPAKSTELLEAYHACQLFLLPSIHEPFGIVILEAWAAQKPVVASNVGGIPSFVTSQKNALLCQVNQHSPFLDAIEKTIRNNNYAQNLAQNGFGEIKKKYSWEKITRDLICLYENVIEEHYHV